MLTLKQLEVLKAEPLSGRNRLRRLMAMTGATQEQIEAATGLTQPYISALVNGRYRRLPIDTAGKLADFFGVHIEDVFPRPDSAVAS